MKNQQLPQFQFSFFLPKYWILWLGIILFRLILFLPYPCLVKIGHGLGKLFSKFKFGKRRLEIARRNLELCFPEMSELQRQELLKQNIQAVGMAIIETGMAWFWSDNRIKKWSKIEGLDYLTKADSGIILVGIHFLTLELGARILGLYHQGIGVYRPNDNPLFDWLQTKGRIRSNKSMLDRHNLRGMIRALRQGETIWYAPDHDYGRKSAVFVPFFAVKNAATTTGTAFLKRSVPQSLVIPFTPLRNKDGSGYTISISAPIDLSDCEDDVAIVTRVNQAIEREIKKDPSLYMWLHRRFKTRPEGEEVFY
ncbi:LpxL/LpxP family Kdo(2)-lipid IV(A) lauroyl/palmitoleoyl acyltransferase [Gallibacterium genomosp. 1]|uniref:Lipid A biosynthesis acyltransferase n=1 Tax=Gallibacterium genomosp. 1 TaxID=155515 RepID=A0A0A2Y3E0_9PAST|nr:LpxL/LpxP family Kdo(2)-lipid IV(A) lauroyl/palmitoleoyl acyltransferase [Gallibacterium genomosp. 1]KGQ37632.1 lipid A biosynthesis lauroyl acyltransferase [Gallibacterium genomosp. 1]OBW97199.1 lipid A biosynthesis lauroyl acyltransferase [Gallibacterium genomosp. 1]OBX01200.1 lipid A biosynthesis lauroyl acyltransferase [Gallibacterium genomosp. 1]